jgi:hypothetical protein
MKSQMMKFKTTEHFYYRALPNGKVRAINLRTQAMIETDAWAGMVWKLLKTRKTLPELSSHLQTMDPSLSKKLLFQVLPEFIERCEKFDLIERS